MIKNHKNLVCLINLIGMSFFTFTVNSQDFDSIRIDLDRYYNISMQYRRSLSPIIQKHGQNSFQFDSLNNLIYQFDSLSLIKAKEIIGKHGWLGESTIGKNANNALFLIIQHSDPHTMRIFFPLLEQSVLIGESERYSMALMKDRILVSEGNPQKYGTQYYYDKENKRYAYYDLDDMKLVAKRRREIGLNSLKKEAKKNNIFLKDK